METIEEFKNNVKNNATRKKFFIDKFKTELNHLNIEYDENEIEKLLLEAIDTYNDFPTMFSSYGLNYIKEKLQSDSPKQQKNEIFSEQEMAILNLYLTKDSDNNYLTTDKIANKLEINISDVSQTINKLKRNIKYNYKQTCQIFHDIKDKLSKRKLNLKIDESNNITITDEDIEILGFLTGQINDICLDIEEIAKEKNTSTTIIMQRIKNTFKLLSNQQNYSILTSKYPTIEKMLRLKGKALGITIPETLKHKYDKKDTTQDTIQDTTQDTIQDTAQDTTQDATQDTKNIKEKKEDKLNQPDNQKKHYINNNIITDYEFLKYLYKPKADGTYYSRKEIEALLGMSKNNAYNKKHKIMNELSNDKYYRKVILKLYPELYNDIEIYEEYKSNKRYSDKQIEQQVKILQYLYKPKADGTYYSIEEISNILDKSINALYSFRYRTLKLLKNNTTYKEKFLEQYPELNDDIELYNKNKSNTKKKSNKRYSYNKILKDFEFLKYLYKPKADGTYYSMKEISNKLDIYISSSYKIKEKIFTKLDDDLEYKEEIIKLYPNLYDDIELYNKEKSNKKKKSNKGYSYNKILKDFEFLKYLYKPKADGTYYSMKEISNKLEVYISSVYRIKERIITKLNNELELEYKEEILKLYPNLYDDIELYNKEKSNKKKKSNKGYSYNKILKDFEFLKYLYKPKADGTYYSMEEISNKLNIYITSIYKIKKRILTKLNNELELEYKEEILKLYPNLYDDIENKSNQKKKSNKRYSHNQILKDLEFLRYIYKPKADDTYYSINEIINLLDMSTKGFYTKKHYILDKINDDKKYKSLICKEYPELDYDINKYNEKKATELKTSDNKIINDCKTLKYIYKKQDDGTYLSIKEIATLLNIKENSVYNKRRVIMNRLSDDKYYKKRILKLYPELYNDIETYKKNNIDANYNSKIEKDIKILKYFYKRQDNGAYLSTKEIADKLNIKPETLYKIKIAINKRLREDLEYKDELNKKYPELDYDIQIKEQISKSDYNESTNLTKNEQLLLDKLYIDKTRTIKTKKSYCEKLDINTKLFDTADKNLTIKLVKDKKLKKAYPNFEIEKEIVANYFNIKSVTLSEDEFVNIKNNSKKYDLPNYKSKQNNLLKGIELLEKSNYSDYISLCNYEQKTMLALRLGYFNNTLYSTENISNLFNVSKEEIAVLTKKCINSNKQKIKG